MSRWIASLFLTILVVCPAVSGWAGTARVVLQDQGLTVTRDGVSGVLPKDTGAILSVQNSSLRAVQVSPDEAEQHGLDAGLYLFTAAGEATIVIPEDSGDPCAAVALSPDGKVLAVDSGAWVIRSWTFYTYPALKNLGGVTYRDDQKPLLWLGGTTVLLHTQEDVDQRRQCDYDPCGPISVERVDLWPFTVTPLFRGTDLCDFAIERLEHGTLTVNKICAPSLEAWGQENDASRITERVVRNVLP